MKAIAGIVEAGVAELENELSEMSDKEIISALDHAAYVKSLILETIRNRGLEEGA